jgi:release factor glutamine methyltransferase
MNKAFFAVGDKIIELDVFDDVYEPSDDSFLLAKNIPQKLQGNQVLEIGSGSGIISLIAAKNGANVTAVDVESKAVENTRHNADKHRVKIMVMQSNLFEKISEKYDLILFNPPYVPCSKEGLRGETAWVGGVDGREFIDLFLKDFRKHLKANGKVLMIVSSKNRMEEELKSTGWKEKDFSTFFFEKLSVMEYANNAN